MLSVDQLRKLAGPGASIDERTRDQLYEVARAILDTLDTARRQSMRSPSRAINGPFPRLVPNAKAEAKEEPAPPDFGGGQRREEAEPGTLRDLGFGGED